MDTIHSLSSLTTLPQFDLFGVPPTQLTVEYDLQSEHRPISTITNSVSPIQFEIHTGIDEYINLGKSELYLCLQISLSKTNMAKDPKITEDDWKQICPINYLLHTFFKQVKLDIGQTTVTSSTQNYGYISYLDALLNTPAESKRTHLKTAFWYRDTPGEMDKVHEERSARIRPKGGNLEHGCEFEMYGNLHLDLCGQSKSLPGGVTLTFTFIPNDPKFYLIYNPLLIPKVTITDMRLFIHRSKLNPQVVIAHNKLLNKSNALYFITRKEVKPFIIPKDSIDFSLNNVENGVIPRKIAIGLVSNDNYNGNPEHNALNIKNYSADRISCFVDGKQYPLRPYSPRFSDMMYMREYYGTFEAFNQIKPFTTLDITLEEFKEGFTLYGFNFTPDLSDTITRSGYASVLKTGNLRIEFKFKYPLIETVTALVFCEYDNRIEIDSTRTAFKNFM